MTINALLSWAEDLLQQARVPSPRVDAEWMLVHTLSCSRAELHLQAPPLAIQMETYRQRVQQRSKRVPLQHVLGETEFYGLPFYSTPQALIPRPDTETLIEAVGEHLKDHASPKILDIGTGSGIIAITLAHTVPQARVLSLDISKPALELATRNARLNQVTKRVHFAQSNLFTTLAPTAQFDAIVSNPPYIPTRDILDLDPEVRDFDPHLALDGGTDGLDFYRQIIPQSLTHLKTGGFIALEMGHNQAEAIAHIVAQCASFGPSSTYQDLGGQTRVLMAQKQK